MELKKFISSPKGGWMISALLLLALVVVTALPGLQQNAPEENSGADEAVTVSAGEDSSPLPRENATEQTSAATDREEDLPPDPWLRPMAGEIGRVMGYDYDETFGDHRYHHGIDIMAEPGTAVYAAAAGRVIAVRVDGKWGGIVSISHSGGWETDYRCVEPRAGYGDQVEAGQIIGYILESAPAESAQEAHLHFEMYLDGEEQDPQSCLP